jgi:hypothetical protein
LQWFNIVGFAIESLCRDLLHQFTIDPDTETNDVHAANEPGIESDTQARSGTFFLQIGLIGRRGSLTYTTLSIWISEKGIVRAKDVETEAISRLVIVTTNVEIDAEVRLFDWSTAGWIFEDDRRARAVGVVGETEVTRIIDASRSAIRWSLDCW